MLGYDSTHAQTQYICIYWSELHLVPVECPLQYHFQSTLYHIHVLYQHAWIVSRFNHEATQFINWLYCSHLSMIFSVSL